jgi:hypothetical protein
MQWSTRVGLRKAEAPAAKMQAARLMAAAPRFGALTVGRVGKGYCLAFS